jgi:hypothetical protein
MLANPTDKPWLPENVENISDFNLTLPITSRKQLQDIAKLLRQQYYFTKLPDSWINLQDAKSENAENKLLKQDIPDSISEIYKQLKQK